MACEAEQLAYNQAEMMHQQAVAAVAAAEANEAAWLAQRTAAKVILDACQSNCEGPQAAFDMADAMWQQAKATTAAAKANEVAWSIQKATALALLQACQGS